MDPAHEGAPRSHPILRNLMIARVEYTHPRTILGIRVVVAAWVLGLGIFAVVDGYWWGLALVAAAACILWFGRAVYGIVMTDRPGGRSPQANGG
jgi:hypothetical protein